MTAQDPVYEFAENFRHPSSFASHLYFDKILRKMPLKFQVLVKMEISGSKSIPTGIPPLPTSTKSIKDGVNEFWPALAAGFHS